MLKHCVKCIPRCWSEPWVSRIREPHVMDFEVLDTAPLLLRRHTLIHDEMRNFLPQCRHPPTYPQCRLLVIVYLTLPKTSLGFLPSGFDGIACQIVR
uniref:Uncharacterized protein n=1 Tax=Physcomitrium patens TaxID=3218 RepID=A0A7I3Z134_PHYPA